MAKMFSRYLLLVKSSETREEEPLFTDNLAKAYFAAKQLTERKAPRVVLKDTKQGKILFASSHGEIIINK